MLTDRFLKLPIILHKEDHPSIIGNVRLNPFSIEAYYADEITYEVEQGLTQTSDCVHILTKNDEMHIMMGIEDFEKILNTV